MYIQGVSGGIVNILGGGSMDYFELISLYIYICVCIYIHI